MIVKNSSALWNKLKREGGLDLSRPSRGNNGYDVALEIRINEILFPGSTLRLTKNLRAKRPQTEKLLAAFFQAQLPFSMMLQDILTLFEKAGAQHGASNFQIEFNFEQGRALGLDLEHFRKWATSWKKITTKRSVWIWSLSGFEHLIAEIRRLVKDSNDGLFPPVQNDAVGRWCKATGLDDRGEFRPPPKIPTSGHAGFDQLIVRCDSLVEAFHQDCISLAPGYQELIHGWLKKMQTWTEAEQIVMQTASDHRTVNLVGSLTNLSEAIATGSTPPDQDTLDSLNAILNSMYAGESSIEELKEILDSLLSMPSWKFRHEIYAVWVCSQIICALESVDFVFHVEDNVLAFPFSGAHLATFFPSRLSALMLWTELRSSLPGRAKSGRYNIQPDYRVVALPLDPVKNTLLIVECKQYRRSSTSNFSKAINDYASGCPNAHVIMVNNGPIGNKVMCAVIMGYAPRTSTIADFRPDNPVQKEKFRELIQQVLFAKAAGGPQSASPTMAGSISLAWDTTFKDLDLIVTIRPNAHANETIVSFQNLGDLVNWPRLQLKHDVTDGPGVETVNVSEWQNATYDIYVNNYSTSECPDSRGVNLTVEHPKNSSRMISGSAESSILANGRCWHVCSIMGSTGEIVERKRYLNTPPA